MVNKQHYNEKQLGVELERYLTQHLENYQWRFDNMARSYKYSEKWLPENIERTEKELELLHMKIGFYKTQLDNLFTERYNKVMKMVSKDDIYNNKIK